MRFILTASVLLAWCQQEVSSSSSSPVVLESGEDSKEQQQQQLKRKLRGRQHRQRQKTTSSSNNLDDALFEVLQSSTTITASSSSFSNQDRQQKRRRGRKIVQKNQNDSTSSSHLLLKNSSSSSTSSTLLEEENEQQADVVVNIVECDPSKDLAVAVDVADSGILSSCGNGYYCIESHTSSKGGICVQKVAATAAASHQRKKQTPPPQHEQQQQRNLMQDTPCTLSGGECDHNSGYFCDFEFMFTGGGNCEICPCPGGNDDNDVAYMCGYIYDPLALVTQHGSISCQFSCFDWDGTCGDFTSIRHKFDNCDDQSQFDSTTNSGIISCTSNEYCGYGCCYTLGGREVFDSTGNKESNSISYIFTSPYDQNVTITYYDAANVIALGLQDNCAITIDNQKCTSCHKTGGINKQCIEFDCENISPNGKSGETCDEDGTFISFQELIPIYNQCFFEGHGCNICGLDSGNVLMYDDETAVVPGYNVRFECEDIYDAGLGRLFGDNGSDLCNQVSQVTAHRCCSNRPNLQASICNICDEYYGGSILTEFETEVLFAEKRCDEFYLDGLLGKTSLNDCTGVANFAGPTCCTVP